MRPAHRDGKGEGPSPINRRDALRTTVAAAGAGLGARDDIDRSRRPGPARTGRSRRSPILAQGLPDEEVDQSLGVPLPAADEPARVPSTGQGRRVRRHRAELRSRKRPLAQSVSGRLPGDPQDGRGDRHRHQRPVLVPVLALLADRQRLVAACPGPGAGPADDRRRTRAGHREPADDRRLDVHPLAPRPRAGADRRLRPPRPRGDRLAASRSPRSAASRSTSRRSGSTAT